MRKVLILLFITYVQSSELNEVRWKSIIDKVNSAATTWTAGYNFDRSISTKSLKPLLGVTVDDEFKGPYKTIEENGEDDVDIEIPKEFDARKKWPKCKSISHVRDQGSCGSCWAVAAAEAFTDRVCIASKGKRNPPVSSEELLTCCNDCGYGCDGGSPWYAWQHIHRYGLVTGGDYHSQQGCKPYSLEPCEHHMNGSRPQCSSLGEIPTPACHFKCSNKNYRVSYFNDKKYKAKNFYVFLKNETEALQKDILLHGPVESTLIVYEDFLTYKSGVYQHITGDFVGRHAVKIIGWGVEKSLPYWLVVNSWNSDWGDNGYIKILRDNNACACQNFAYAGIPRLQKREEYEEEDNE